MEKYKTRTIEKSLNALINTCPVIMITGPRQVGKTTLLNHLVATSKEKINYISLDNLLIRSQAIEDPELFLRTYETPLIIDEFQYAPELLSYIKIKVDNARQNELFGDGKNVGTLYYLTGSQVFQTMQNVSESLAGRIGILDLYGFSEREIENKEETIFLPDIKILKNTNLIYMLPSYSNNNVQKAIKRPKLYFMDTGLACYLTGYMSSDTLEKSAYNGAIFETYIISEIIKSYTNNGKDPRARLYYYRDTNQKEIDLLIFYDNKVYPVEIKKSANPGKNAIKNFDIVSKFGTEVGNGTILCMMENIMAIDENNYYVPIEYV